MWGGGPGWRPLIPVPPAPPGSHSPRVRHHDLNHRGRDIEVGEIHGCFSRLEAALALVGFDAGRDRLFAVGDLVDRGPESAEVLNWHGHGFTPSAAITS